MNHTSNAEITNKKHIAPKKASGYTQLSKNTCIIFITFIFYIVHNV